MALGAVRELRGVRMDAMEAVRRGYPYIPGAVLSPAVFRAEAVSGAPDAYVIAKLGESGPARLFGVNRGGI